MMTMVISGSDGVTFPDSTNQFSGGAFSFKNRIINGDMRIDQRNAGASVTPTNTADNVFLLDRWATFNSVGSKFSVQQNAGSVTPPIGFQNYLGVTSLAATVVGASERYVLQQPIEGFNAADLDWGTASAKSITLSFWVRSSLTGTFGGSLNNSALNRSYPFTYSISVADTWEYKTVTIAGDTSGTWLKTNGLGIRVYFGLGVGSSLSGTAGSWSGSTFYSATGATSVVGTNGATFYITGVQLEVGSVATPFERRPYGTELMLCQRYYWNLVSGDAKYFANAWQYDSTSIYSVVQFAVTMRATPTLSHTTGANYYTYYRNNSSDTFNSFAFGNGSTQSGVIYNNSEISGTGGHAGGILSSNANSFVSFAAEL